MIRLLKKRYIGKVNWYTFLRANYFSRGIKRNTDSYIIPFIGTKLLIYPSARIQLDRGDFIMNYHETNSSIIGTSVILEKNSVIKIVNNFSLLYGADIKVFSNGVLEFGSGYANAGIQIRCSQRITIGNNAAIAKDVVIMDSDAHEIDYSGYVMKKPIFIEDDVWIGTRAMILKGVTVGKGSIVAAGAVVTKSVPPFSLVAGVPARVVKQNVSHT